jgi:hypothetical protein
VLPLKRPAIFLSLAVLLSSLTACANSPTAKNLEQYLAADPRLQNNSVVLKDTQGKELPTTAKVELPANFPQDIPIYPNAEVKSAISGEQKVSTIWQSTDPSNFIASFYRQQFQTNNWQVLQQPTDDLGGYFEARRQNLQLKVTIQVQSAAKPTPNQPQALTKLIIEYINTTAQQNSINNPRNPTANISQPGDSQFIGPVAPTNNTPTQPNTTPDEWATAKFTSGDLRDFPDLTKISPEWRQYIQDLAALGIFAPETKANKQNFAPSTNITRREYARWLVTANNGVYAKNPAKQIRLAAGNTQSAFSDVLPKDPDFPLIQGLAEAGLIPSPLSGDATVVLFRPDAPLTREQLIMWKVPLDTRQVLPVASLEAVKQTWGFQDGAKIDPRALSAVLADFQNGEQSNIRRVFGYTRLFQPKKPVTRAEAAVTLWYFGTQGEGISVVDALKLKR